MGYLRCTKELTEIIVKERFSPVEGKKLLLWPSLKCPLCPIDVCETRQGFFRDAKYKYGFSLLLVGFNGSSYKDALTAGWGNDELVLAGGIGNILSSAGYYGDSEHWTPFTFDSTGRVLQPQRFRPSKNVADRMKCPVSEFECHDPRLGTYLNPNCEAPTFWTLYHPRLDRYCMELVDALEFALDHHLSYFNQIYNNLKNANWNYPYPLGKGGPFYAIYTDEPLQLNLSHDIFGDSPERKRSIEIVNNYIRRNREQRDERFYSPTIETQYWVGGHNSVLHPSLVTDILAPLCDRVFYTQYKNTGAREIFEFLFGVPHDFDQRDQWKKLVSLGNRASAWISLESDETFGEFGPLTRFAATDANWNILGVFGGENLSCGGDKGFHSILRRFLIEAMQWGWAKRIEEAESRRRTLYCWKPGCACDPDLPEGWYGTPLPGFFTGEEPKNADSTGMVRHSGPQCGNDNEIITLPDDDHSEDSHAPNRSTNIGNTFRAVETMSYYLDEVFITKPKFW
jgi:hypothetical protein